MTIPAHFPSYLIRIFVLTGLILSLIHIPVTSASAITCSREGNFYNGYIYNGPTRFQGIGADVTWRRGEICEGGGATYNKFNTSWVLLAGSTYVGGYSQVGTIRFYGGSTYFFSEFDNDGVGGFSRTVNQGNGPVAVGGTNHAWVQYVPQCSCLRNNIDVSIQSATNFNPYVAWSTPFDLSWSSETSYRETYSPGTPTGETRFARMQVQWESDHGFRDISSANFFQSNISARSTFNQPYYQQVPLSYSTRTFYAYSSGP